MDSNRSQSEFNMAVSYLNRLNNIFYMIDNASIVQDVNTWYYTLIALFRELSTEMNNDEISRFNDRIMDISKDVQLNLRNTMIGRIGLKPELFEKLHNLEIDLRKVLKESGLQQKLMDEADKALR